MLKISIKNGDSLTSTTLWEIQVIVHARFGWLNPLKMTIKAFRQDFNEMLGSVYPTTEIDSLFFQLMEHVLNISRAEIILNVNSELDQDVQNVVVQFMNQLEKKEPIQYIIGQTSFAGIPILLNRHVLIPRPETESLVYWIKSREPDGLSILDICTGSGCIAFALENHISAKLTAWDISNDALKVAKQTAVSIGSNVSFSQVDILKQFEVQDRWDVIVSNPPYVLEEERPQIHANVLEYEPHLALFSSKEDPIQFYRAVIQFANLHLNPGGRLYFELNPNTAKAVTSLLKTMDFVDIVVENDMQNQTRMLVAKTKK
ncbi:MAG: protein-(glutamine-N5) methyltransferase, release factor-specific [Flavobacteriaceae bacterium]|nr:protein-(glutamine-N5) methyltransferase, release factor-specific [Flavobacteriaceae bacterium]